MVHRDFSDIDRELENLGIVPSHLSRIVARYGGWGLDLDEVDESLAGLAQSAALGTSPQPISTEQGDARGIAPQLEFQEEPEAEVTAGDAREVFQDDIDDSVAEAFFVEAESPGLIQRPGFSFEQRSSETTDAERSERVEYVDVLAEELTPVDPEVLEIKASSESGRHSFAEFVQESSEELTISNDRASVPEPPDQTETGQPEYESVYFSESEEELPATEERRAYLEEGFGEEEDELTFAVNRLSEERVQARNSFRDSEYKRLLDLELDPSDFPQSEPSSKPPSERVGEAEFEALEDDDIVELADDDIEVAGETVNPTVETEQVNSHEGVVDLVDDDSPQ
ncbi:MAG: hypothetical protein JXA30_16760 [Deltaproteobacteria bacterium]|nr:hypothetical protein [Deltaproteobacteria bacterium]